MDNSVGINLEKCKLLPRRREPGFFMPEVFSQTPPHHPYQSRYANVHQWRDCGDFERGSRSFDCRQPQVCRDIPSPGMRDQQFQI